MPAPPHESRLLDDELLVLLDLLDDLDWYIDGGGSDVRRSKGEPLAERDIGDTVGLVNFKVDKLLGLRGVLNVVARVVWEDTSITSSEVEGSGKTTTNVDSSTGVSAVEVEPFLGL